MMYVPSIFGDNWMDDWMDSFDRAFYGTPSVSRSANGLMRTDITEKDDGYVLDIDLPGFKKEDLEMSLSKGYLNIQAKHDDQNEEKNKEGKVIHTERYTGSLSRRFYVGDQVKEEDIRAKFENGILKVFIPKKDAKKEVPEKKTIAIEG